MFRFLLLLIIDWIIRRSTADNNTGTWWNLTSELDELDYADDTTSSREQTQVKVYRLVGHASNTNAITAAGGEGMFISISNMTWFFSPSKSTDTNSALFPDISALAHWQ